MSNLKETIRSWDYFVSWDKVLTNTKEVEIELNLLNYLIGKSDIKTEAKYLLQKHPSVLKVIPTVIGCRDKDLKILDPIEGKVFNYKHFRFVEKTTLSNNEIDDAVDFMDKVGFLNLISNKQIKNLVDYVLGVEVGLDSNGRKNRSGTAMENLVELYVKRVCSAKNFQYKSQATVKEIEHSWGYDVPVDKTDRRFDFAIDNGKRLFLIETNYYGGSGSKLKATAGEYKSLFDLVKSDKHTFIWITDGLGWLTAKAPLRETFDYTDYIFNLEMLEHNLLDFVVLNNL